MTIRGMAQGASKYCWGLANCLTPSGWCMMAEGAAKYWSEAADSWTDGVRASADALNASLGQAALDHDVSDPGKVITLGVHSHQLASRAVTMPVQQIALTYFVAPARVRSLVPARLELETWGGKVPVIVSGQRFGPGEVRLPNGKRRRGYYNEISYSVAVSHHGVKGVFPLKLRLNWQEAVDIGVQKYGFNKAAADVSFESHRSGKVAMAARDPRTGQLLVRLCGREATGSIAGIDSFATSWTLRDMEHYFRAVYTQKGNQLLRSSAVFETSDARGFDVDAGGILVADSAVKSVLAGKRPHGAFVRRGMFNMGPPCKVDYI